MSHLIDPEFAALPAISLTSKMRGLQAKCGEGGGLRAAPKGSAVMFSEHAGRARGIERRVSRAEVHPVRG